ncbi:hypothetical protein [uncultured phage_Deep1-GF2-KM23-C739]|uniref:Uncharacterized protein n=1 Tax=uncultured phage_Deep1-GF2-KM23-C739 TaxID=2740798 RepID=A0A1B1IVV5_9CAUD|nr:hypothetical protein HOU05_gp10 [uncultured phage_Deep1-GF2-KM23-C739]ANS05480.1 hypothetical protein [uncultured phage_Deep1-GF2-KM23-C739]
MGLVKEIKTKTLIEVVKQLESMRNTYRRFHKYEIPVGNPIEKNIKNICSQLEKFTGICSKGRNDSLEVRISPKGVKGGYIERKYGGN